MEAVDRVSGWNGTRSPAFRSCIGESVLSWFPRKQRHDLSPSHTTRLAAGLLAALSSPGLSYYIDTSTFGQVDLVVGVPEPATLALLALIRPVVRRLA